MSAPFAALETRVNRAVADRLANATAVFAAGSVDVVFDEQRFDVPLAGPAPRGGRVWRIAAPADDFVAVVPAKGATVTVNNAAYELVDVDVSPSGWTTWTLRKAT